MTAMLRIVRSSSLAKTRGEYSKIGFRRIQEMFGEMGSRYSFF